MSALENEQFAGRKAIEVNGISKRYRFKPSGEASDKGQQAEFHALSDVSFELMKGEVVSIIGSNGSGKTTLLKILSSVTKPTEGEIRIHGRTTSILDIGSNFHPDLTGRENALMHFRLNEVSKDQYPHLLKEIQQFSAIGEFFDQPVKYYSNGMFLRLAFSVVFNLASDVLILDEVLSVGDENFKMKSYHLIKELRKKGCSILFVSHNRNEILELSNKCIWLDKGRIKRIGAPVEIMGDYFGDQKKRFEDEITAEAGDGKILGADSTNDGISIEWNAATAPGNPMMQVRKVVMCRPNGDTVKLLNSEPILLKITIDKLDADCTIGSSILLHNMFNEPIILAYTLNNQDKVDFSDFGNNQTGLFEITCELPARFLIPGIYYIALRFGKNPAKGQRSNEGDFHLAEEIRFRISDDHQDVDYIGDTMNIPIRPALKWSYTKDAGQ